MPRTMPSLVAGWLLVAAACLVLWMRVHAGASLPMGGRLEHSGAAWLAGALWSFRRKKPTAGQPEDSPEIQARRALEDDVTGIANRQALLEKLQQEKQRERRQGEPTTLLLVQVDDLAAIEADGGKVAADVAMLTLARALTRCLPRRADLLSRYDSSTFAVVLPGTDLSGTLRVAARLRWSIIRLGIAHPTAESGFLTATMGIAVHHEFPRDGSSSLMAAAESALFKARRGGVDRLEYLVVAAETGKEQMGEGMAALPSIRAWNAEQPLGSQQN